MDSSYTQEAQVLIFLCYLNQSNKYTVNKSPLILHAVESEDGNNAKLIAASPFFYWYKIQNTSLYLFVLKN